MVVLHPSSSKIKYSESVFLTVSIFFGLTSPELVHSSTMEVISVAASLVVVATLAGNILSVSRALRKVNDDRFDDIYWRLFSQKETTVGLITTMAHANYRPSGDTETFVYLLKGLSSRYEDLERQLRNVYPFGAPPKDKVIMYARRVAFQFGRFDEMKQTLSAIESMNGALEIIARPSRKHTAYPRSSFAIDSPVKPRVVGSTKTEQIRSKKLMDLATIEAPGMLRRQTTCTCTNPNANFSMFIAVKSISLDEPVAASFICLSDLHSAALGALKAIQVNPAMSGFDIKSLVERLDVWGAAVFQQSGDYDRELDLDELLRAMSPRSDDLYRCILENIVGIMTSESKNPPLRFDLCI
jgi:hypothetical protein